ncbi:choice-of-anchor Q domain-containing protein [Streptosporangium sp. NPDC001559]|uniref:choice-of-anchor Q domain-containing protein n=1 Tax=Streptosporangium sp. NPDC001559 TaxID=3366187 RepID=UPI0036E70686
MSRRRSRFAPWAVAVTLMAGALASPALAPPAAAQDSSITVQARDLATGAPLPKFQYIVNADNTRLPDDPDPALRTGVAATESNSPVVAEGDQDRATLDLPDGRYLVSVRSDDHKMWGRHITLPRDAGTVQVAMSEADDAHPLPLGKIRVFVFDDNQWANGAPDTGEAGLPGFQVTLEEQTNSQVAVDYHNRPLCGGDCRTASDGFVQIDDLGPATYFIKVTPPDACGKDGSGRWTQTTTIDGGVGLQAGVEEGSDGTGAPGESLWEPPDRRTGYWFGFVCTATDFAAPGTGSISGTAKNWKAWPPFEVLETAEPVESPYIALTSSANDTTLYVGQGDEEGNFTVPRVPPGSYILSIWDEQLSYITRFLPVEVTAAGQRVDLGDVGVSRWFGWLSGHVYQDTGVAADGTALPSGSRGNGVRDCADLKNEVTCEPAIPNTDVDQRWRDGSIKDSTFTDAQGRYEYTNAEGGPLGKWFIGEVGFARFGTTGAAVHSEYDPSRSAHVPTDEGGGLLTNQLVIEGHRSEVDWGKYSYGGKPGQIIGITYFATTRNEFDARMQVHEKYEPGIPGVTVRLEGPGPDNQPGTADDVVLNEYVTDHWKPSTGCDVLDHKGDDISVQLNPLIGPKCVEVPATGNETRDAAFDGGYAFADHCPAATGGFGHFDAEGETVCGDGSAPVPLVAGTYVTHVVMPADPRDPRPCNPTGQKYVSGPGGNGCLYRPVREEDVNVDLGGRFTPAIPPPPCVGDGHVIDQSTLTPRSPYHGVEPSPSRPLCDKRLVVLQNNQNANADFHLMTNFRNGPDVAEPGRIVGLVSDDIYFDRDPKSVWYGEPRAIGNIPIGIRDYNWRLITTVKTSENGGYEALLPSTETYNCPIPQGTCPGMYVVVVNDPGDKAHPNPDFNPDYLTASFAWDVWPGQTDQLDTPLDPISGTACELPVNTPEVLEVSTPYTTAGDPAAERRVTIQGDFFGTTAGSVTLGDPVAPQSRTLTVANGGIVSWGDRRIVITVPPIGVTPAQIRPGPKQLSVRTAAGFSSVNGLTFHVRGNTGGVDYRPPVVEVAPPTTPGAIQSAVNVAAPGSLLVLKPGVYHENVLMWKPLLLQGLGPGGLVGARELLERAPEDPRADIQGTVVDGRFFHDNKLTWTTALTAAGPLAGVDADHPVLEGAGITVAAKTATAFPSGLTAARIDGLGVTTGQGQGAGGVQLQAHAANLQITNDIFESDGGLFAGGIGLGQPYTDSHNTGVKILNDRILGSGGLARSGGIGIFRGSDGYEVARSIVCGNFGVEYGAGISHWGLSPGGSIHDNQVYYNDSVDSGAGISVAQEIPRPLPDGTTPLGDGSGAVDVERNLVQSNYSGDDGGGLFIENAHTARVNVRNNMIVDNGAADLGGGIMMDDSANVAIVNNTVANNVSTASCETCDDTPHSAGLAAEANDPLFQATLPPGSPTFANPVALFDNVFWQNQAFTLSKPGPGATLVSHGSIDLEIHGTANGADTFTPRYSSLTAGTIRGSDGADHPLPAGQGNVFGQDPRFVQPFTLELAVAGSRLDPQTASVTITGQDPPVGLTGDYHLTAGSPAINRGAAYSTYPAPRTATAVPAPPTDYDGQTRPRGTGPTPFDLGADEVR